MPVVAPSLHSAPADNISFLDFQPSQADALDDVLAGLNQTPKTLNPRYFYDQTGSELFEKITEQPEYYPTRTEKAILTQYASEIAQLIGTNTTLIEPGCGSCEKIRLLLDALKPNTYVAMDISSDFLQQAAEKLHWEYPWLDIQAICADFSQLHQLGGTLPPGKRIFFYPGSTLGNFTPQAAQIFLRQLREIGGENSGLLIGIDRHKSSDILNAAYNDSAGITAEFNLNALTNLNNLLTTNFDPENFEHHAFYSEEKHRIEMHLRSTCQQQIHLNNKTIQIAKGETLHTENSYKYTPKQFNDLAAQAGWNTQHYWSDPQQLFSIYYCE